MSHRRRDHRQDRFKLEVQWLTENRKHYAGQWVALVGSSLLASGNSAKSVFDAARIGNDTPTLLRVDIEELPFAGW